MTTKFTSNEKTLLVDALETAHKAGERGQTIGVLKTITQHRDAPGFPDVADAGYTPADEATDVAVDAAVSCEFDCDIEEVDLSGVKIDGGGTPVTGVSASINVDGVTVDITHDAFVNEVVHTVTIPAEAVKNTSGIPNKEAITWSFTTVAG